MRYRAEMRAGRSTVKDGDTLATVIGKTRSSTTFR